MATQTPMKPVNCPRCGGQPSPLRTGAYWRLVCNSGHELTPVTGHTMKTKTAATQEWNREHGKNP